MFTAIGTVALVLAIAPGQEPPSGREAPTAAATAKAFSEVFAAADATAMRGSLADHVLFAGDLRFVVGDSAGRTHGHLIVTREQLGGAYVRLFERVGQARWAGLLKPATESLKLAAKDGDHLDDPQQQLPEGFVKAGDYVYELRMGGRTGLDDTLLFVLRPIGGKLLVAAHWADY